MLSSCSSKYPSCGRRSAPSVPDTRRASGDSTPTARIDVSRAAAKACTSGQDARKSGGLCRCSERIHRSWTDRSAVGLQIAGPGMRLIYALALWRAEHASGDGHIRARIDILASVQPGGAIDRRVLLCLEAGDRSGPTGALVCSCPGRRLRGPHARRGTPSLSHLPRWLVLPTSNRRHPRRPGLVCGAGEGCAGATVHHSWASSVDSTAFAAHEVAGLPAQT